MLLGSPGYYCVANFNKRLVSKCSSAVQDSLNGCNTIAKANSNKSSEGVEIASTTADFLPELEGAPWDSITPLARA